MEPAAGAPGAGLRRGMKILHSGSVPEPSPVVFSVARNNGTISDGAVSERMVTVNTDAVGQAQVNWTLGSRAGQSNNIVEATGPGFQGTARFTATGTPGTAFHLHADSGENQAGIVGQPLPQPFAVVVTDVDHNRVGNVPVTFTVLEASGSFDGQPTIIVNSDLNGRALATLTLGAEAGITNNFAQADVTGNTGGPVGFFASAETSGDPALTSISGVVLDNTDLPIEGVTVTIPGTTIVTATNLQGQFFIQPAPVGNVELVVDGGTALRPGTWPELAYPIVTIPGRNNSVGQPIYLLPIDEPNGIQVSGTQGGTLTIPSAPGFSLTIEPGAATFPDGTKSGLISATVVHADKIPMTPNFGQQPRLILTFQPAGVIFDPPAKVTYPNVDGLAPGEITELYSFDHDMNEFVSIGTGSVSDDGALITSNPGVGILKGGWQCAGNPQPTGQCQPVNVTISPPEIFAVVGQPEVFIATGSPLPTGSPAYTWNNPSPNDLTLSAGNSQNHPNTATVTINDLVEAQPQVTYLAQAQPGQAQQMDDATGKIQGITVTFKESANCAGFDDNRATDTAPWFLMVPDGMTNTAVAEIMPATAADKVNFKEGDGKVSVTPPRSASVSQPITITGNQVGNSTIDAVGVGATNPAASLDIRVNPKIQPAFSI